MSDLFGVDAGPDAAKADGFAHEKRQGANIDWHTPQWIFIKLGLQFDLDPCCPPGGVPWIPATNHISLPDNGLTTRWKGRVWLNPPYGDETAKWLSRMDDHRWGIALVFARTDTEWFHRIATRADAMLLMAKRISFVDAMGRSGGSGAGAGSMMIVWGDDCVRALANMRDEHFLIDCRVNRRATDNIQPRLIQ
jgi:hypothetical protein